MRAARPSCKQHATVRAAQRIALSDRRAARYLRDSGLLHALLDIETLAVLEGHPKLGAFFCVEAVLSRLRARSTQGYFCATHAGNELDLLVVAGNRRHGFEMKRAVAPRVTPSMRSAMEDLKLDSLDVVHAGDTLPLGPRTRAVALARLLTALRPLHSRA
jgi:uncharacterized protein